MKALRLLFVAMILTLPCFAWNCPAGEIRQQAPAGTATNTPYYDVVEGIAFICVPTPTSVAPTSTGTTNTLSNTNTESSTNTNTANSASNSNSTSNSTSAASSNQTQQQKQGQSQTARGGNATSSSSATGGNATGNGNNSNNTTVEAPKIPVASAYAPTALPSAPCVKGYGGGAQTATFGASFGAGKIDQGCDERETARAFALLGSKLAACKVMVQGKEAKKAGVTMEDCMGVPAQVNAAVPTQVQVAPPPPSPSTQKVCVETITYKDGTEDCMKYVEKR